MKIKEFIKNLKIKSKRADIEQFLIWLGIIILMLLCLFGLYKLLTKLTT